MRSKKLKILWLHAHFMNQMGGHNYIFEVISRIKKKHPVSIICSAASSKAKKRYKAIGVELNTLSGKSTYNFLYWILLPFYIKKELNLLKKRVNDYDIVIVSHFPFNVIASKLKKPYIFCCWEPYAFFYDQNYINGFNVINRVFIKIMGYLYKSLDIEATKNAFTILTLSKFNKLWIKKVYKRTDAVITYEGVDTKFFKPSINLKLNKKYNSYKIILHSTDFTAIKGTENIIRAMPQIIESIPNVRLLVTSTLNDSNGKDKIVKLATSLGVLDKIEFLGRVSYGLLPSYYSLARVVVQPSINQSMSLSVKEAMACETPIVTCLEGNEQTKNGEAGYLVNPHDTDKIASVIIKLLKNPRLAVNMGKKGRRIIINRFSWAKTVDVFNYTIKELINA